MLKFAPTILFILILIPSSTTAYGATSGFFWLYVGDDPIQPGHIQRLAAEVFNRSTGEPIEGMNVSFQVTAPNGYSQKYHDITDSEGYAEIAFKIKASAESGRYDVKVTAPKITTNSGYFEVMEAD
jgi:5-hydroxyisourate hydrolase-like protein (transthyretin family)